MNKTIKTKSELLETVKYYLYMFFLIVLFFIAVGILSVVKSQAMSQERNNALAEDDIAAREYLKVKFNKEIK